MKLIRNGECYIPAYRDNSASENEIIWDEKYEYCKRHNNSLVLMTEIVDFHFYHWCNERYGDYQLAKSILENLDISKFVELKFDDLGNCFNIYEILDNFDTVYLCGDDKIIDCEIDEIQGKVRFSVENHNKEDLYFELGLSELAESEIYLSYYCDFRKDDERYQFSKYVIGNKIYDLVEGNYMNHYINEKDEEKFREVFLEIIAQLNKAYRKNGIETIKRTLNTDKVKKHKSKSYLKKTFRKTPKYKPSKFFIKALKNPPVKWSEMCNYLVC